MLSLPKAIESKIDFPFSFSFFIEVLGFFIDLKKLVFLLGSLWLRGFSSTSKTVFFPYDPLRKGVFHRLPTHIQRPINLFLPFITHSAELAS